MASIELDLSGAKGLIERYQGDLNSSTATPNLRYYGSQGQVSDGIYNPFKKIGYMSPAVNAFTTLTGKVADLPNTFKYDATNDILYISEEGENILKLDGLDDLSISNYKSLTTGVTIKDMELYELYGTPALYYIIDSGTNLVDGGNGLHLGFSLLDTTEAITFFDAGITSAANPLFQLITDAASENYVSFKTRKIAQAFTTADITPNLVVSGVEILLSLEGGTGTGITIKASIQTNASASTSPFTSRGAWSNAVTNYAINDTVTNGGFTWQCIQAHSAAAAASDEPGVGAAWQDYWNRFGAPSGTEVASGTIDMSTLVNVTESSIATTKILFSSSVTLSANTKYWLVIEESGSVMTTGDELGVLRTVNNEGTYDGQGKVYLSSGSYWKDLNPNGDTITTNHDIMDLRLTITETEKLSNSSSNGSFNQERGIDTFLYLADNSILYWVAGNKINSFDGSTIGGYTGRASQSILSFPSYMTIADISETRSRMYIGIQTSNRVTPTTSSNLDKRFFTSYKAGVFVWDRRSQILGQTDFFAAPGAKEIKSLFQGFDGNVYAITESSSGFCEIRVASGNQYQVIHTLERFAFPLSRKSVQNIGSTMTIWLGANGYFYGFGQIAPGMNAGVYKLGKYTGGITDNIQFGPIIAAHEQSNDTPRIALLFSVYSGSPYELDSYSNSNIDDVQEFYTYGGHGQTIVGDGSLIESLTFYLRNTASVTGGLTAAVYEISGGVPTTLLATSVDSVDVSTIGSLYEGVTLNFNGNLLLEDGITYMVALYTSSTISSADLEIGVDSSSPTHTGTSFQYFSGTWIVPSTTYDIPFILNVSPNRQIKKWYPNGEGTLSSTTQTALNGNIYYKVDYLPSLSIIRKLTIYCTPVATSNGTTIATIKLYKNQSTTPFSTKTVTNTEAARGYVSFELNEPNVNAFQIEIEHSANTITGTDEFEPSIGILDYDTTRTHTPDNG